MECSYKICGELGKLLCNAAGVKIDSSISNQYLLVYHQTIWGVWKQLITSLIFFGYLLIKIFSIFVRLFNFCVQLYFLLKHQTPWWTDSPKMFNNYWCQACTKWCKSKDILSKNNNSFRTECFIYFNNDCFYCNAKCKRSQLVLKLFLFISK